METENNSIMYMHLMDHPQFVFRSRWRWSVYDNTLKDYKQFNAMCIILISS